MTTDTPTTERVAATLQDYLRVATETGELRGTVIEYGIPDTLGPGVAWVDALLGNDAPPLARATVYREGWAIPTVVTASWDESIPLEDSWRGLWETKPQTMFGAFTLRSALRRAFADVLGDRREPDDHPVGEPEAPAPTDEPAQSVARVPWLQRVLDAQTEQEVEAIREEARGERAIDPELHMAMKVRLRDLAAPPAAEAAPAPKSKPKPSALDAVPAPTAIAVAMQAAQEARAEAAKSMTPVTPRTRATRKQG
ncbi:MULTISPECIES: hypothetical protein [unclassified Agrococcus]|uniref:hypothetical protein n=1 Tax=unclassified Agrococcus TaxID=2615065 RepID=UPI0036125AAE